MEHTSRYAFKGRARLAADVGVSRSTITRLIDGRSAPSFTLVSKIAHALERQLKRHIDPHELFSTDGEYPTPSVCDLCGCPGCMPDAAYDDEDNLKAEFRTIHPGDWSLPDGSEDRQEDV